MIWMEVAVPLTRYAIRYHFTLSVVSMEIATGWACTTPRDLQHASRGVHEVGHVAQGGVSRYGSSDKHNRRFGLIK